MKLSSSQKDALETIARFTGCSEQKAKRGYGEGRFHHGTVKALLKRGYVERTPHQVPFLGRGLVLTDAGREALSNADKPKPVSEAATHPRFLALPAEEQEERLALRAEFMAVTRGVSNHTLAILMPGMGVDYRGCTKGMMADCWLESWASYRGSFDDSTLSYYVQRLDDYLANEAERERGSKVYSATMDHRDVIDWAHEETEKEQATDIRTCAKAELKGVNGIAPSRSRAGLAKRGYMEKRGSTYFLTGKGWAAAARSLYFEAGSAQSKRNEARRRVSDRHWRGNKKQEGRTVVEQDRRYRRLISQAERALQRSQRPVGNSSNNS